jgi:hypothetical protein
MDKNLFELVEEYGDQRVGLSEEHDDDDDDHDFQDDDLDFQIGSSQDYVYNAYDDIETYVKELKEKAYSAGVAGEEL